MHMEKSFRWSRERREIFLSRRRTDGAWRQIGHAPPTVIPDAMDCADSAAIAYARRSAKLS